MTDDLQVERITAVCSVSVFSAVFRRGAQLREVEAYLYSNSSIEVELGDGCYVLRTTASFKDDGHSEVHSSGQYQQARREAIRYATHQCDRLQSGLFGARLCASKQAAVQAAADRAAR